MMLPMKRHMYEAHFLIPNLKLHVNIYLMGLASLA